MPASDTARQFWIETAGRGAVRTAALPPAEVGDVLVRTLFSGISRGTEALVFRGAVPRSQYAAMRAPFQEGDFPSPVKYGYSSVGTVEDGPDRLRGRTVFCLYPHQDRYRVPEAAVHLVPDGVPAGRAVLAANMETAVNIVWDARPTAGDEILVVGGGVVGLLAAVLCRDVPGARVTVVDPNRSRAATAEALGLHHRPEVPGEGRSRSRHPRQRARGGAARRARGRRGGSDHRRCELVRIERGVAALGEAFHSRRLTIRSSQVGRVPPARAPRWTTARRLALALGLLADGRLDVLLTARARSTNCRRCWSDWPRIRGIRSAIGSATGRRLPGIHVDGRRRTHSCTA